LKRIDGSKIEALVAEARGALKHAYAPYSKLTVGAAVLTKGGQIYTGVNVENAAYGESLCAERSAIAKAVAAGARKLEAIAVVTGDGREAPPCGSCRQVINEFLALLRCKLILVLNVL